MKRTVSSPDLATKTKKPKPLPMYDDDDEQQQERTFNDVFFDDQLPFLFNKQEDAYFLDASKDEPSVQGAILEERDKNRCVFSRDLTSYKNGDIVFKHCAPWGDANVLNNNGFIIMRKFFHASGDVVSVLLQESDSTKEFLVESPFFSGWTSAKMMMDYFSYHDSPSLDPCGSPSSPSLDDDAQ